THELSSTELTNTQVEYTSDPTRLKQAKFIIVAVPTPIDESNNPDLSPLLGASRIIGQHLSKGTIVVFESTVYPGATEEDCVPILEKESGLVCGQDFKVGYSPERINPGDKKHNLRSIVKVVSAQDADSLACVSAVYKTVVDAGIYPASSIKVAEAAKVIENTQRDLNIALMNELAIIFNRMGINTREVIEAAATKWNFVKLFPGLVGGHCIGVDPYYLTHKAQQLGYHPEVILAGRRINDNMGKYVAEQTIKHLIKAGKSVKGAKVVVLGFTFKENVSDIRNTRVIDVLKELEEYGVYALVCDPLANPEEIHAHYPVKLTPFDEIHSVDAIVLTTAHREFESLSAEDFQKKFAQNGHQSVFIDVKSTFCKKPEFHEHFLYWTL
ncbi:MAG: nucleotide sugar dehydrogenase, partial [Candidatus Margulisiibacteriota bacterium]